jgi:hypothetical protein
MHPQYTRQQFVKLCECGCGQPTLLAPYTYHGWNWVKDVPLRFLHNHHMKGKRNNHWSGGRYKMQHGYIVVTMRDHPNATKRGTVYEHRLVMESVLGRYLQPTELVHHKDGDKTNNVPENLEVISRADHVRLHKPRLGWRKAS